MHVAVLRTMNKKQYNLGMDYFIIESLSKENIGYRELFELIKANHNQHISFDTFNRHIEYLKKSGMIYKNGKFAPFRLTEKCEQQLKMGALDLDAPASKMGNPSSSSTQLARKQINVYILLLLFKSDSSFEFAKVEELEYFLSLFSLSKNSLVMKMPHGSLTKFKNETYTMAVFESGDSRISVHERRYFTSPRRSRDSISFICNIKGVKYPFTRYRSEPFQKTHVTPDETTNALSLLCSEDILEKPISYSDESIYLATDIQLYDLLSEFAFLFEVSKAILKQLWRLRKPTTEEIEWLQRIVGDSEVAKIVAKSHEYRQKRNLSFYSRQKKIRNIMKKLSGTDFKEETMMEKWNKKKLLQWTEREFQESSKTGAKDHTMKKIKKWLEEDYEDTRSNPKYQFIISEIEKIALPNWFQKLKDR